MVTCRAKILVLISDQVLSIQYPVHAGSVAEHAAIWSHPHRDTSNMKHDTSHMKHNTSHMKHDTSHIKHET